MDTPFQWTDEDFSQADDLAAANPQELRGLQDLWWAEAARHNVLGEVGRNVGAVH